MLPLAHPSVLSLSEYPPVGHPARLEFAVTYGNGSSGSGSSNGGGGGSHAHAHPHAHGRAEHPYVRLDVTGSGSDMYSVYNITSNVGTAAPDVFEPYDHANTTIRAEPGRTYVVRADIILDREGVVPVHAFGLDGDIITLYVAASASRSMPYGLYKAAGETYLDIIDDATFGKGAGRLPGSDVRGPDGMALAAAADFAAAAEQNTGGGSALYRSDAAWLDALAGAYRASAGDPPAAAASAGGAAAAAAAASMPGVLGDMAALGYGRAQADALV